MSTTDATKKQRIELILRQIDSLPTLPVVATRVLSLTASEDASAKQVVDLVRSDQALTAKILMMCRQADRGLREDVLTIDRAVVLLGFTEIRNAVLSLKVLETFESDTGGGSEAGAGGRAVAGSGGAARPPPLTSSVPGFDRTNFWRHSLAVATAAELLAAAHPEARDLKPAEAFVCGLMHDVGKLALDHVLPKSFARVIELTDLNQGNIAEFERRVIGIDHHTAGKRLVEQWQLPQVLQDCVWLHGTAFEALPRLDHRRMIGLVALADLIARTQHIGYSGNFSLRPGVPDLAQKLGLNAARIEGVTAVLHEEVGRRAKNLGLDDRPSKELFMQSIQQANNVLGRLNSALDRRSKQASRQAQLLDAIAAFHTQAAPGRAVPDVLQAVARSGASVFGHGFYALILPMPPSVDGRNTWLLSRYTPDGDPINTRFIEPPDQAIDLSTLRADHHATFSAIAVLPWMLEDLVDAPEVSAVRLLPLNSGAGTPAVMLHDQATLPTGSQLLALTSTWGAAIAAITEKEAVRRMGEELVESNQALAEAQGRLLQAESLARLGEMAAGAAHEMNNPLAVISGRSQLLSISLPHGSKEQKAAETIYEQSHRLSDLITSLRLFSDPPKPQRRPTDLARLLDTTLKRIQQERGATAQDKPIYLQIRQTMPIMNIDPDHIALAVRELLLNALQAQPKTSVFLAAQADTEEEQVLIQVVDDGVGMDGYTLSHAMDPFFSAKKAGRRVGMGLARAQQFAAAHGGRIELRSVADQGTTARLILPLHSESI